MPLDSYFLTLRGYLHSKPTSTLLQMLHYCGTTVALLFLSFLFSSFHLFSTVPQGTYFVPLPVVVLLSALRVVQHTVQLSFKLTISSYPTETVTDVWRLNPPTESHTIGGTSPWPFLPPPLILLTLA